MTMDEAAYTIAAIEVTLASTPNMMTGYADAHRGPLHAGDRVPRLEAERRVQGERATVVRGLKQPDSGHSSLDGPLHSGFHELTANPEILHLRGHRDGTKAGNCRSLIEKVTPDDLTVSLCDHAIEAGMR